MIFRIAIHTKNLLALYLPTEIRAESQIAHARLSDLYLPIEIPIELLFL